MDRRLFLKGGMALGALAALPKFAMAAGANSNGGRIRVGCIGCGGRGTGALKNMIDADSGIQIVALGDLFPDRLKKCDNDVKAYAAKKGSDVYKVGSDTMFTGWDACQKVLSTDCDVVILAAPPVFRALHLEQALAAGKHVFAEKPLFVDAIQARKVFDLADLADKKNLSVVTGFQRRYDTGYLEAVKRIEDGEIGEIVAAQCYWMASQYVGGAKWSEDFEIDTQGYQIRNWQAWIWPSGDQIVEQHCHNLDVINWCLNGKKPLNVIGTGGRVTSNEGQYARPYPKFGDRYNTCSVDFDYGGGLNLSSVCRQSPGSSGLVGERVVGTKGTMTFFGIPAMFAGGKEVWKYDASKKVSPLICEHQHLFKSIRGDIARINQIPSSASSNLMALAGRESAYSGKQFKYDWVLARSQRSLVPEKWDLNLKMPVKPVPVPGDYELI